MAIKWRKQRRAIVDGRCATCNGKPFHKLDCPLLVSAWAAVLVIGLILFAIEVTRWSAALVITGLIGVLIGVVVRGLCHLAGRQ